MLAKIDNEHGLDDKGFPILEGPPPLNTPFFQKIS